MYNGKESEKRHKVASILLLLLLSFSLFHLQILFPIPKASCDQMNDYLSHREYTNTGTSANVQFQTIGGGGFRTNVQASGIGLVWAWIEFDAAWLNGKRINITSEATGSQTSYILIMDGSYNRSDASQFLNSTATQTGLVLQGNGILQTIRAASVWNDGAGNPVNDTAIAGLGSALEDRVSLFFISKATSVVADSAIEAFYLSVQSGSTLYTDTVFDGANHWEADESDPRRYGYMDLDGVDFCEAEDVELLNPEAYSEDDIPWVFAEEEYYQFNASWSSINNTRDIEVRLYFTDGYENITVMFSLTTYSFTVENGSNVVKTPTGAQPDLMSYNSTTRFLSVIFPIYFKDGIHDAQNVLVWQKCNDAIGWEASTLYFHIYNKGGLVERSPIGNITYPIGADVFEVCAYEYGHVSINQTFRKIQSINFQYAIRHYDNISGNWLPEDQYHQDGGHQGAGEKASDPLDWFIVWRIWAYDKNNQTWRYLISLTIAMNEGDEGADDEWEALYNLYEYQNATYWQAIAIGSEIFNVFIEEEQAAKIRLFTDIWFNKANASSIIGIRNSAYYYGMEKEAGYLNWGDWKPQKDNQTQAMAFTSLRDYLGNITFASEFDLMKIQLILDRGATKSGEANFMTCVEDFNIYEVKLQDRGKPLEGVNTPIFEDTKVPDMPQTSIFSPIYAMIGRLGSLIFEAASAVQAMIWGFLENNFPWFTDTINMIYTLMDSFFAFLSSIADILVGIMSFFLTFIDYIALPFQYAGQAWAYVVNAYTTLGITDEMVYAAIVVVLLLQMIYLGDEFSKGHSKQVMDYLKTVWGIAHTILDWSFRLAKMIIDFITGLIP